MGGDYELDVADLVGSNAKLKKFKKSSWYKYAGSDKEVKKKIEAEWGGGPMYFPDKKDFEGYIKDVFKKNAIQIKKEKGKIIKVVLDEADLEKGLKHKLVII